MKYDINQEDKKWLSESMDHYKKFKNIFTLPKNFSNREFFYLKIPLCISKGGRSSPIGPRYGILYTYIFLEKIRDLGNQKRPSTLPFVFIVVKLGLRSIPITNSHSFPIQTTKATWVNLGIYIFNLILFYHKRIW